MFKHYINNIEIEEPEGFNAAIFTKRISKTYFGYFGGDGFLNDAGSSGARLSSTEYYVAEIIKAGIEAPYKITWNDVIVYDGIIDQSDTQVVGNCEVSFSLKGNNSDAFVLKKDTVYGIDTDNTYQLGERSVPSISTHKLDSKVKNLSGINVLLPYEYNKGFVDSSSLGSYPDAILSNNSSVPVSYRLFMQVRVTAKSQLAANYSIIITNDQWSNVLVHSTTGLQLANLSASSEFTLLPNQSCIINASSDDNTTVIDYDFNSISIDISAIDAGTTPATKTIKCLKLEDAIVSLLGRMDSGNSISKTEGFQTGRYVITNGYNLRGEGKPLSMSFDWLFGVISKIFSLSLTESGGGKLEILSSRDMIDLSGAYPIDSESADSIVVEQNKELSFGKIHAGYERWQSGDAFGSDEFNGLAMFEPTNYKRGSTTLSLTVDIIASTYLIYKQASEATQTDLDDRIFIIDTWFRGADSGLIQPSTILNGSISPRQIINNWSWYWGHIGEVTNTYYEGNGKAIIAGQALDSNIVPADRLLTDKKLSMTMEGIDPCEFKHINRTVLFRGENGPSLAFVESKSLEPNETGGSSINIESWIVY